MEGRRGLLIVYTGPGKGKTTAALGLLLRAWGRGWPMCVVQFIKHEGGQWGEVRAGQKLGIEWHQCGDGFTWRSRDLERTARLARDGWELARQKIGSGRYRLVLLDEFTYPLHFGWLDVGEVVAWLVQARPAHTHVVITGRDAPEALLSAADLVTRMELVRHPYQRGEKAVAGIDF